jgi:hypothetical protein
VRRRAAGRLVFPRITTLTRVEQLAPKALDGRLTERRSLTEREAGISDNCRDFHSSTCDKAIDVGLLETACLI